MSFKSEGNKSSGVKLEQLEANMSAVSLQVTPDWYKDPYRVYGWVSVTEAEPFSWKVSSLNLAKNGRGVRGNNDRRWSFHILDCFQGIPDSFQLHRGAARKHLVCSSSLLDKFTIAENEKNPPCSVDEGSNEPSVATRIESVPLLMSEKSWEKAELAAPGGQTLQSRLKLMMTVGSLSCSSGGIHTG